MISARFPRRGNPLAVVSRPSLYTTNSSLNGSYSQRRRALMLNVRLLDAYCVVGAHGVAQRAERVGLEEHPVALVVKRIETSPSPEILRAAPAE